MKPAELGLWLKCNEFFALASKELALLPTPLLLRFFSPVAPLSPATRPWGLPFPLRFSPAPVSSEDFDVFEDSVVFTVVDVSPAPSEAPPPSELPSFGGDPELPNILFSRPPWEEKLLLLLPATFADFALCVS
jgi:hypothetical protein